MGGYGATSLMNHLETFVERLVTKAHRWIDNETNNKAENYMFVMSKFNSGKCRAYLASLSFNQNAFWLKLILEKMESKPFGTYLFSVYLQKLEKRREDQGKGRAVKQHYLEYKA